MIVGELKEPGAIVSLAGKLELREAWIVGERSKTSEEPKVVAVVWHPGDSKRPKEDIQGGH